MTGPQRLVRIESEFEETKAKRSRSPRGRIDGRPGALGDQVKAPQQNWQPARLIDEIDSAAFERGLLVEVVGQHRQKDHRGRDPCAPQVAQRAPQVAQHFETGYVRHPPVQQYDITSATAFQIGERVAAIGKAGDLISFVDQVEPERLMEQIVIVDDNEMRHSRGDCN